MGAQSIPLSELQALLSASKILTVESEGYQASLHRWSEAAEKNATAVVQVTNASDVSQTLKFARKYKLDFAVVGGGHSTSDANVVVDYANKTITAERGTIWEGVDFAAAKYGLATVGGTVNHTGVGGLTLGEGYGWLTGKCGLTIGNLLSAEVVVADGRILRASENENPDLFRALRGAGQSFGVATSFTFRGLKRANPVYGGLSVFKKEALEKVVEFANWLVTSTQGQSGMVVGIGAPAPARKMSVMAIIFYNGEASEAREYYKPLFALNPVADLTKEIPYRDVNAMLNTVSTHGDCKTQKGSAFSVLHSKSLALNLLEDYSRFIQANSDAVKTIVLMKFSSQREVIKVPQTAMSFANRGEQYNILFSTRWVGAKNDKAFRDWIREMGKKVDAELRKQTQNDGVGEYCNYDGVATSSAEQLFGVNYEGVLALRKHFDRDNVLNKGAGEIFDVAGPTRGPPYPH